MKSYEVLQSFKGSPDGRTSVTYIEGEVAELTDSLAKSALAEGWIKEVGASDPRTAPADELLSILDESVPDIKTLLPDIETADLGILRTAEEAGKTRSSLIAAIDEELANRDES